MQVDEDIRKKANKYFFVKVLFNAALMIIGAVIISIFLTQMQHQTALLKQRKNNEQSLSDAISVLENNSSDAKDLSILFHDGNQDMLDDLKELFNSGLFDHLAFADNKTRSEAFADIVERSGVDYLFVMYNDGTVAVSPIESLTGQNLVSEGYLSSNNLTMLLEGTKKVSGSVVPVLETNSYGSFYFYSLPYNYNGRTFTLVLGANSEDLDIQINSLTDVSIVLSRAVVGNNGFLFAVNRNDNTFLFYENGREILTGKNALEAGLSETALKDGYSGVQVINGTRY